MRTKIPTPEECRDLRRSTLDSASIAAREYISEELRKHGGGFHCSLAMFPTGNGFNIWEIIEYMKVEFRAAGWNIKIVCDQRDGDFFSVEAIAKPRTS